MPFFQKRERERVEVEASRSEKTNARKSKRASAREEALPWSLSSAAERSLSLCPPALPFVFAPSDIYMVARDANRGGGERARGRVSGTVSLAVAAAAAAPPPPAA